jgi:hypothetical protein
MDRIANHADSEIASVYDRHGYALEDRKIMEHVAQHILDLVEGRADDDNVVSLKR